jgi:tetratricopeptide (TPR) repeat protein
MKKNKNGDLTAEDWFEKGHQLALSGKYAAAIDAYEKALDHNTVFAKAYFGRGACYYKLGHYQRAADDINIAAMLGCKEALLWSR